MSYILFFTTKMHVSQWRSLAQMSGGQHAAGIVSNTQILNHVCTEIHNKNIHKYKHACLRMKVIGPDERGATGGWLRANESFRCQSEPSRRGISSAFFFYIFAIIWSSVPFLLYPFPLFEHLCLFSFFCHYLISSAFFVPPNPIIPIDFFDRQISIFEWPMLQSRCPNWPPSVQKRYATDTGP